MSGRESGFIRNVITVGGGSAVGQVVLVLASPLITRIYGPETFGVWGVFNSVVSVIYPVVALTYTTAIVLPRNLGHARALARLSFWLTLFVSAATTTLFIALGPILADELGIKQYAPVLALTGIYTLVVGVATIGQQWLIRTRSFGSLAISNVAFAGFAALAQILGGLVSPSALTLVASNTLGRGLHAVLQTFFARRQVPEGADRGKIRRRARKAGVFKRIPILLVAGMYKQFPLFRAPQVVLDGLSQAIPVVFLATFFGPGPAGLYALSRTVLSLPGQVVGNAVADVFYSRVSIAAQGGEPLYPLVQRATLALLASLALPFAVISIFGPSLFALVFGPEWEQAGAYGQWLSVWLWVVVANRPAVQAIHVLRLQRFHLVFTVIAIVVRLASMYLPSALGLGPLESVMAFSLAGTVMNLMLIVIVMKLCWRHDVCRRG